MYEIKTRNRVLRFDGVLLAFASSYREGASRWTEFTLYRTEGETYILHRVGVSRVYHRPECSVARKNQMPVAPWMTTHEGSVPCPMCTPERGLSEETPVAIEQNRYWATICDEPEGVVDALYQVNDEGARYLTNVAEALLEEAGRADSDIDAAYRVETIF